ncbi:MAG: SRPBCC domain-containing protein [Paracoccaceae bacterium]
MSDFSITAEGIDKITVTRSFAAPVAAVVKAHMEPDMLMQWMSMPEMPLVTCEVDARPGGGFRYVWQGAGGDRMSVVGTYLEMDMAANGNSRIVHTELFDPDWTEGLSTVETTFTGVGDRTVVKVTVTYSSAAARDGAITSGMAEGMTQTYAQLDGVLAA